MPNWSDDEGRYWWNPPGKMWYDQIEIPHPPVGPMKDCPCAFCVYENKHTKRKEYLSKRLAKTKNCLWRVCSTYKNNEKVLWEGYCPEDYKGTIGCMPSYPIGKDNYVSVTFQHYKNKKWISYDGDPRYEENYMDVTRIPFRVKRIADDENSIVWSGYKDTVDEYRGGIGCFPDEYSSHEAYVIRQFEFSEDGVWKLFDGDPRKDLKK